MSQIFHKKNEVKNQASNSRGELEKQRLIRNQNGHHMGKEYVSLVPMAHTCIPSYLGG
jgi:hypothetical protein